MTMSENKQYILIPFEEGNLIFKDDGREFFNSVDCLKDNEIVDLLNDQDERIKELEEENEKLKEIFMEQLESALSLSFVKEVYCNALLRILDENDSVEESKKFIKDYLFGDSE